MKLTRLKMLGVVMCAGFALAAVYGAVGPRATRQHYRVLY
jgi:hypothetical protein